MISDQALQLLFRVGFCLRERALDEEKFTGYREVGISPSSGRYGEMNVWDVGAVPPLDGQIAMVSDCDLVFSVSKGDGGSGSVEHETNVTNWRLMDSAWHCDNQFLQVTEISEPTGCG